MIWYPGFWQRFFPFLRTNRWESVARRADVPGSVDGPATGSARRETDRRPAGQPGRMEDAAERASRKNGKTGR